VRKDDDKLPDALPPEKAAALRRALALPPELAEGLKRIGAEERSFRESLKSPTAQAVFAPIRELAKGLARIKEIDDLRTQHDYAARQVEIWRQRKADLAAQLDALSPQPAAPATTTAADPHPDPVVDPDPDPTQTKSDLVKQELRALYPPDGRLPKDITQKVAVNAVNDRLAKRSRKSGEPPIAINRHDLFRALKLPK
jgi:hypothetical protein